MSRQLGAFDDDENFDRPDLNKCPDCGCYFSQNNCPFCGKACPEDMRAGMRKPVKVRKKRSNGNGRVTFVEWYHSWWFILIMTFVFPLAAVFLLISSPYAKKWKILFTLLIILSASGILNTLIWTVGSYFIPEDTLVNTEMTREEYTDACSNVLPEQLYRNASDMEGSFVCAELVITDIFTAYTEEYDEAKYYLCTDTGEGKYIFLIRDCRLEKKAQTFTKGDVIRIYGEGAALDTVYHTETLNYPAVNMAYAELVSNE